MLPIVHGLEETFEDQVTFVYLNAADGDVGQRTFEGYGLPGHPSYILFNAEGEEVYRTMGSLDESQLYTAIIDHLAVTAQD